MHDLYSEIFSRNIGFLTQSEQNKLKDSTVGIAGVGGVGGLLAERLIRIGTGHLKITDPGDFERSNINRQYGSSMGVLGRNKAEVISARFADINPLATIDWSSRGIRIQGDADILVKGCDVIVDEMDFGMFKEAVFLQRAARQKGIYYMFASAIGFGALIIIFDPKGMTLEEYNGFDPNVDPESYDGSSIPFERISPVIPSYAASMPLDILDEILASKRHAPTNSIGVGLASLLATMEVTNILLNKRDIPCAPRYTYIDMIDRQFKVGDLSSEEN